MAVKPSREGTRGGSVDEAMAAAVGFIGEKLDPEARRLTFRLARGDVTGLLGIDDPADPGTGPPAELELPLGVVTGEGELLP